MSETQKDRREMSLGEKCSSPEVAPPPWSLFSAAITVFAMLVALISVGPALASILLGGEAISHFLLMLSWCFGMTFAIVFVLASRRSSDGMWSALCLRRGHLPLPFALLIGVAIALSVQLFVSLASSKFYAIPELFDFWEVEPKNIVSAALLLILLQPVAETLVFQAIALPSLRWNLGPWIGVLLTSVLFTLLHLSVFSAANRAIYINPWYDNVYPFLTCFAFSMLKVYSGSNSAVIIGRMGAGLVFFLTGLAVAGA